MRVKWFHNNSLRFLKYGLVLIAGLFLWAGVILIYEQNWVAFSALTMLILALAAFWAIWQTYRIRKDEKRQRLLNEIIDWAIDIIRISWGFGEAFKEAIKPATEREQQLLKYAHVAEVKEHFMQFAGRNVYITAVASQFTEYTKSLQEEIKVLEKDLIAYIIFLDNWQRELRWTPSLGQDRGFIKIGSRYPQGVWC